MILKHSFISLGMAAMLFFCGCDSNSSDPDETFEDDVMYNTYPIDDVEDEFQLEVYNNFIYLDLAYLYGHTRNEIGDNYRIYLGKGTSSVNSVKGYCKQDYYDVCYMYNQMADPFTQYFDPNVAEVVYKSVMETDEVVGIGAEAETVTDAESSYLVVTQIYPNSPSAIAGLQEGDIIVSVDGIPITKPENFEKLCSGEIGSTIQIVVRRGEETLNITAKLDQYHAPSVKLHYEDSIPVIEILQFSATTSNKDGTYGEFLEALKKTEGYSSTIIDLRQNPGGDVDQCNKVSGALLSAGDTIIIDVQSIVDTAVIDGRKKVFQAFDTITYVTYQDGIGKDRYYVLMASDSSASCAETFLSAVSVNKKTPIVGITSYGKGIGQAVLSKKEGIQGLALITALQGVDKNGESYHDLGIVPDFQIFDPAQQMAKAVELAKEGTFIRTAGYGTEKLNHFSKAREESSTGKQIPTLRDLKTRYKIFKK